MNKLTAKVCPSRSTVAPAALSLPPSPGKVLHLLQPRLMITDSFVVSPKRSGTRPEPQNRVCAVLGNLFIDGGIFTEEI